MEFELSKAYPHTCQDDEIAYAEKVQFFNELNQAARQGGGIREIFSIVSSRLKKFVNFDRAGVALLDKSGKHYYMIAHTHKDGLEDPKLNVIPLRGTAVEWVVRNRKPLVRGNLACDKWSYVEDLLIKKGIRSDALLPLISRGSVLGVLMLGRRKKVPFSDEEMKLIENVATHISAAVDNSALFDQLKKKTERLEKLLQISRTIVSGLKSEEVLDRIVKSVGELLGVSRVLLFIYDEKEGELRVKATLGLDELIKEHPLKFKIGEGVTGWIAENKEPAVVPEIEEDPRWVDSGVIRGARIVSCAGVPLLLGDRVLGVLNCYSTERRIFAEEEIELLRFFADHAAIALENSNLYEAALEAKNYLQYILDGSIDAIIAADLEHRVIEFSRGAENLTGYSKHEVIGRTIEHFYLDPTERERMLKEVTTKGAVHYFESKWRRKDSSIIDVARSISQWKDSRGRLIGYVSTGKDITGHKRAEEKVRKEKEFTASLIKGLKDGFAAVDQEGKQILVNDELCKMTGFSEKELIDQKPPFKFWAEEGYKDIKEAFEKTLKGIEGEYELIFKKKNGERFIALVSPRKTVDPDGKTIYFATVKDITERKRAEEQLRQSEAKYRTLFEESKDAVFISTPEGKFIDINSAGVKLFGYSSKEELLKIDIARDLYMNPRDRIAYRKTIARRGFVKDYELALKRKDDQPVIVLSTTNAVYDDKGKVLEYRGILRDITEHKAAEEKRKKLEKELKDMNQALAKANRELHKAIKELQAAQQHLVRSEKMFSLGRLAAGVAHEILNPLNVIYMLAQMVLKEGELNVEQGKSIEIIKDQCKRIEKIVESLRHFSRKEKPEKSLVDVHKLLDYILTLVEKPMLLENILVKRQFHYIMPELMVDRDQMAQVFINIISNARDAMPKGGELTISTALVKRRGKQTAMISFSDTGCGIEKEILPKIFDPFFTTKSEEAGTGLGLSICQGIVENHGGSIEVKSLEGKGTAFSIYLPI